MPLTARSLSCRLTLILLLSLGSVTVAYGGSDAWAAIGPFGGRVNTLAVDPTDSRIMYVGTEGGIFKSSDGGGQWAMIHNGIKVRASSLAVHGLAIDPSTPEIVHAGVGNVIFRSTNAGLTWTSVRVVNGQIRSMVIDPVYPGTIYVGSLRSGIWKSNDGGGTWISINKGLSDLNVNDIAISNTTPRTIYAGTQGGLYRSSDGGASWHSASALLATSRVHSLAASRSTPALLYAGADNGLFRSSNAGISWEPVQTGRSAAVYEVAIAPSKSSIVYAATQDAFLTSTDGGASWVAPSLQPAEEVTSIQMTSSGSTYLGTNRGVFKNDAAGWRATGNAGLHNTYINVLAIDPSNPKTIYAGDQNLGIFKTTNGGESWSLSNDGLIHRTVRALAVDPSDGRIVYAGTTRSISKSTNGGSSWSVVFNPERTSLVTSTITIDPKNTNIIYAGSLQGSIVKSINSGLSWTVLNTQLPSTAIRSIQIDPETNTIFAAAEKGGILKSVDGGASWMFANVGLATGDRDADARDLAIGPTGSGILYMATIDALYKSLNGGIDWIRTSGRMPNPWKLVIDPYYGKLICSLLDRRMFSSLDGGLTWSEMTPELPVPYISTLAVNPKDGTIYAGTAGAGVIRWSLKQVHPVDDPPADTAPPANPSPPVAPPPTVVTPPVASAPRVTPRSGRPTITAEEPEDEDEEVVARKPLMRQAVLPGRAPSVEGSQRSVALHTGQILLVRYEGKYAAIQALEQTSRERGAMIKYRWWYQPDGTGSFVNQNVLAGTDEAREIYPEPGKMMAPQLNVGPIVLGWTVGGEGQGWIYSRHPDILNIVYELVSTEKTDIRLIDAKREFK